MPPDTAAPLELTEYRRRALYEQVQWQRVNRFRDDSPDDDVPLHPPRIANWWRLIR